jgi:D-citramalate synthase
VKTLSRFRAPLNQLVFQRFTPERFGRKRQYALKNFWQANIEKNLQELGLKLNAEDLKLVTRIIELGDKRDSY